MFKRLLLTSAAVAALAVATPQDSSAQQVTSGIRGVVTGPSGAPLANVTVVVTDTRTGRATTTTTTASGGFSFSGLEVGGPYTVLIDSDTFADEQYSGIILSISQATNLNVQLGEGEVMEEIVVTGTAGAVTQVAIGPSASFGLETLENLPSVSRDIRDTIRLDPRVTIDATNDDNISCLGGNNRFNSFTIDGVRTNDVFGLNASGFPSRNTMPIPFDAVRETAVEFSPFDVQYGQFTGCSINVVTKSGTNEFHGSAFAVMNSDSLTGKTIDGDRVISQDNKFRDWDWGVDLGGPVVKDKLFFYTAYEETSDSRIQNEGPIGAGFASETFLTVDEANRIQNILESSYGQNTLGFARTLPEKSRRVLARVDWFINDQHRLAATYTRLHEVFTEEDDFGFDGFAFKNNFENSGSDVQTYSLRLFSDWTENFSTELRISRLDNHDIQDPVGGGEAQSGMPVPRLLVREPGRGDIAISGPGFFRSANALNTQIDQVKAFGEYRTGRHTISAGYELDQLDVFNLFVPNAVGTLTFNSIDDLEAGVASGFDFASTSFTQDVNDAAANFSRSVHSLYLQDELRATDELTLNVGIRYDFYASSDRPPSNPRFMERYGFDNTQAFNGLHILQPRFGFNYEAPWDFYGHTTIRGGAGVFTGGDPTVWFSNSFTNFGSAVGSGSIFDDPCTSADRQVLSGGSFTGVPQCIFDAAQAEALSNNGPVDAVDPNFKLPSVIRGSIGFTHLTDFGGDANGFFDDWQINFDIIHTERRHAPDVIDLTLSPIGFAPDGRPIFERIDPLRDGCNAVFLGPRLGYSIPEGELAACTDPDNDQDTLLTNAVGERNGGSTTLSIQFNKQFQYSLGSSPGTFDFTLGYAFTRATEHNPTTSSTAGSNIEEVALSVVNMPPLANSQFVNRHNLTLAAIFRQDFFADLTTTLGIFFQAREGRPFSYVWSDHTTEDLFGDTDDEARQLLYVPTGPNDPLVDFSNIDPADVTAFLDYLKSSGLNKYAGGIAPRNVFRDPWFKDLDLRISQEFPTPWAGHHFEFFVDFENFLNFLGDGMNIFKRYDRGDVAEGVPLAAAHLEGNRYVYDSLNVGRIQNFVSPSVWAIQLGVRYRF